MQAGRHSRRDFRLKSGHSFTHIDAVYRAARRIAQRTEAPEYVRFPMQMHWTGRLL
jgi:hypothetical protein